MQRRVKLTLVGAGRLPSDADKNEISRSFPGGQCEKGIPVGITATRQEIEQNYDFVSCHDFEMPPSCPQEDSALWGASAHRL